MKAFVRLSTIAFTVGFVFCFSVRADNQSSVSSPSSVQKGVSGGIVETVEEVDESDILPIETSPSPRSVPAVVESTEMISEDGSLEFASDKQTADTEIVGDCSPPERVEQLGPTMPAKPRKINLKARFGNGFELYTADEEFTFQAHNLTQIDYRDYGTEGLGLDKDGFVIPREWLIFQGKLTKPIDYYFSVAYGHNTFNILDVYFNWHVIDDRLQVKLGRYKTPFTYEFYNLPIQGLVNPERSLFFNNYGLNRDLGAMVWGTVFDKRLDYAAGIFNGTRNGLLDTNNAKDFAGLLNFRPFGTWEDSALQYLNIGGSTDVGQQDDNLANPQTFRTIAPNTLAPGLGMVFLNLARDVRDFGPRAFWTAHTAWYYQSLSLIAEYEGGFQDYARTESEIRINVPAQSYYVQAGYFITGETVTGRGSVQPSRPFDIREGMRGVGAIELFTRWNQFHLGDSILSLTDGLPWTNTVRTYSLGTNWYWNQNIKFVFEWEHSWFGNAVTTGPGITATQNDTLLFRSQIYF